MPITKIHLDKIASYKAEGGTEISDLKKINFFYGTNGCGKTTISRVLNDVSLFSDCVHDCPENEKLLVFNEEFKQKEVFETDIKGVFTLGSGSKKIKEQIKVNQNKIDAETENISTIQQKIDEKESEIITNNSTLRTECWTNKTKFESEEYGFKDAFVGYRDSHAKFYDKVLTENESNTSVLQEKAFLVNKAKIVFGKKPVKLDSFESFDFSELSGIENNELLQKSIVGKGDVEVSELILKLENSDWVKTGLSYIQEDSEACPFCQTKQDTEILKSTLSDFFDETYEQKLESLRVLKSKLISLKTEFKLYFDDIDYPKEVEGLRDQMVATNSLLMKTWDKNIIILDKKILNPSLKIDLDKSDSLISSYETAIGEANTKIESHNKTVKNYSSERKELIGQVWKFVVTSLSKSLSSTSTKNEGITKAVQGMTKLITAKNEENNKLKTANEILELQINSLKPTISEINKTLKDFGYNGFEIVDAETNGHYRIVRDDNTDARATLSEGEKTFISFLYFYYRINGLLDGESLTHKKIIVIDDPISSLDNNVIFVVSSMIKKLMKLIDVEDSPVVQLFVMTHNIFFHKEVTYAGKGVPTANRKFWIIRKKEGVSYLQSHDKNPILSTYQMMWKELETANPVTICNVMRRILETYFQHYGDTNLDELPNGFEGDEKLICRSLISWIHDGSHNIMDDLYYSLGDDAIHKYKEVFKRIFEVKGQITHHDMMMEGVSI